MLCPVLLNVLKLCHPLVCSQLNQHWLERLRLARHHGICHGGWVSAPEPQKWQEALKGLGLGAVDLIADRITSDGGPFGKLTRGGTAKDEACELIVQCLSHGLTDGINTMPAVLAREWADAFLAPVGPTTPLFTGTAETAPINTGVVFVLGEGTQRSVGCLWVGDELADDGDDVDDDDVHEGDVI